METQQAMSEFTPEDAYSDPEALVMGGPYFTIYTEGQVGIRSWMGSKAKCDSEVHFKNNGRGVVNVMY